MTQRTSSEVDDGCRKLFQDIASGRIVDLIAGYQRAQRDYLFVVGAKERRQKRMHHRPGRVRPETK
jgi:hypothetical protein